VVPEVGGLARLVAARTGISQEEANEANAGNVAGRVGGSNAGVAAENFILPAALPGIVTGIKLGWTLGWHGVVSAELIKSSVGLGFLLYMGREMNDAALVIGMMIVMIFFGLLLDQFLFGKIEGRIRRRWGLTVEHDSEKG
jgi:NitT/TauT family transport system permease protein